MFYFHSGRGRNCGPRHGSWRRGPFEFSFDFGEASGRGRGGGRRRRLFDGDELRLILLALISDAPRHGYDLIREIEDRTGGAYVPSAGVVYPTLTMLADMGQIEERESEGAKKLYGITPAGEAHLNENAEQVATLMGRLAEMGVERNRVDRAPVKRAMANLFTAISHRAMRGDITDDTLHGFAEIIDEAARKIERL